MEPTSRRPAAGRALLLHGLGLAVSLASALAAALLRRDARPRRADRNGGALGAPHARDTSATTPQQLAQELGHDDAGRAIRAFLRNPDDGLGPFTRRLSLEPRALTPEHAERVRRRFT